MADEVEAELEAVQAVYGDDCHIIDNYPPHLHVHLKPRTADVSFQQFVEAIIGMRAGRKYPEEPPEISIIDSKGLDDQRQRHLVASIRDKALELSWCLMLVSLCEEAVEKLTGMNHPDGNCPLCLYPLLGEDGGSKSQPFMKLMSCFHCFHCDCIMRWWNWTQVQSDNEVASSGNASSSSSTNVNSKKSMDKMMEESAAKCPVCRKVFLSKDIEHVLNLAGTATSVDSDLTGMDKDLLESDSERIRREKFESILKLQQENCGLIEPKKDEVLLPGMFLPPPVVVPSEESSDIPQTKDVGTQPASNSGSSANGPGFRKQNNPNVRKQQRAPNTRRYPRQWNRKGDCSSNTSRQLEKRDETLPKTN